MTVTQQARVAGFHVQLAVRGHLLTLQPDGPALPVLLQPATTENSDYQLAEETSVTDIASILRTDLGAPIQPGAISWPRGQRSIAWCGWRTIPLTSS